LPRPVGGATRGAGLSSTGYVMASYNLFLLPGDGIGPEVM